MNKKLSTKEKLLQAAKELFWTRGFSNVSVRDITGAAGVDAALVSRYFGGKLGLFEATLDDIAAWDVFDAKDADELLARAVASFSHPYDPQKDQVNAFSMLLANVNDPEIGAQIKTLFQVNMADPLTEKISGEQADEKAAMLLASLFGLAMMRKNFQLDIFEDKSLDEVFSQNMHLAKAALNYKRET